MFLNRVTLHDKTMTENYLQTSWNNLLRYLKNILIILVVVSMLNYPWSHLRYFSIYHIWIQISGKGALLARFGKLYEGDFYKNRREGFGVLSTFVPETNTFILDYRGDWRGGHMHGKGLKMFSDGSFYQGNFKWDKRSGHGQLWNKDCSFYDGIC